MIYIVFIYPTCLLFMFIAVLCAEIMTCNRNLKMHDKRLVIFPSLANLKFLSLGISRNCKTNIALCCLTCHVLSLNVLFGHFCAYFPIPFSICVCSRSSCNGSNCNSVKVILGEIYTTVVRPYLNKFSKIKTNLDIVIFIYHEI